MTAVLVIGVLTFAAGFVILRPFSDAHRRSRVRVPASDEVRRRELLRQLRDLDDDLAAGKLTAADHGRLAGPVEREAAAVLRRAGRRGAAAGSRHTALGAGAVGVTLLLLGAVTPRTAGQTASGEQVAGSAAAPGAALDDGAAGSGQQATPEQLAAIDAAAQRVKENPKDVDAHLALAKAYEAGGASQLAAVEWLAVITLDPANAEANTALALLAYAVGQTEQAKAMLDTALAAHPDYPDGLYARGLILLVALHQPEAAEKDLEAYLAVAPFGPQRAQAQALLALARGQDR
jgi:tetratricopeptide (TPR) repeat protein